MLRTAYNGLLHLILPLLPLRLWWRGRKEPGYLAEVPQRFGRYGSPATTRQPLIWLHAVSLGETRAAAPLVRALRTRYPAHRLLITQMTATGRAAAQESYGDFAEIAWLPYDFPWAMRRFLAHYRPALGLIMETELWPNLIAECDRQAIPTLVVNARLSARSAARYARLGGFARDMFAGVTAFAAQTEADAERLRALGAREVQVTGNLKFDVTPAPDANAMAARFRAWLGDRPAMLFASTREGEEALILEALARAPLPEGALAVIVPRHPQRFDEVAAMLAKHGPYVRRSEARPVPRECRFLLGDSMGEMAAYYAACDAAFIGGSLLPYGAQNLIEACAAGTPVLIGPSTFNFAQAAEGAIESGAAIQVHDADELVRRAGELLNSEEKRSAMREAGLRFTAAHRGATERTLALVEQWLLPEAVHGSTGPADRSPRTV